MDISTKPCQIETGKIQILAGTGEEVEEGLEVVRKISMGWKVEWSEEEYAKEKVGNFKTNHGKNVM